jgi:hypothetical protein
MANVIYTECNLPFWVDVAADLMDKLGWRPCYWTGDALKIGHLVKSRFPGIVFQDKSSARRGIPAPAFAQLPPAVLDEPLLKSLAHDETVVLRMMDRLGWDDQFTYYDRVQLYHSYLRYWISVLQHIEPVAMITPLAPHGIYNYVLYALCQKMGIQTMMFRATSIPEIFMPVQRFEEDVPELQQYYASLLHNDGDASLKLSEDLRLYKQRMSGTYGHAMPRIIREKADIYRRKRSYRHFVTRLVSFSQYLYNPHKVRQRFLRHFKVPVGNSLKPKGKPLTDSRIPWWEYRMHITRARRIQNRLRLHYTRMAQGIDFNQPYVFVTLHVQPEESTSPLGGVFVEQLLAIDMLLQTIPEDWYIYVKEHPLQFSRPIYVFGRRPALYDALLARPRVKLVPLSVTPFELIDHAQAVATVTGASGWEAVLRGKPALVFGYAWYRSCEGVFYTPTRQSCQEAIAQIVAGYHVDKERVHLFLCALDKIGVRARMSERFVESTGLSSEQNVQNIAQAIRHLAQTE